MLTIDDLNRERARLCLQLDALNKLIHAMDGTPAPFAETKPKGGAKRGGGKPGRKAGKRGKGKGKVSVAEAVLAALDGKSLDFEGLIAGTTKARGAGARTTRADQLTEALKALEKEGKVSKDGKSYKLA